MKLSINFKILGVTTFLLASLSVFAQASQTVQIDTLTKIFGIAFTIGGFFMGYIQLRMANKLAELEAKLNKAIAEVKDSFEKKIENETDKLENKITASGKEIEAKMATRHDIDNLKTVMKLQHENSQLATDGLKEQLKTAANIINNQNAMEILKDQLKDSIKKG